MTQLEQVEAIGYQGFLAQKQNPFRFGSAMSIAWQKGYRKAQQEAICIAMSFREIANDNVRQ